MATENIQEVDTAVLHRKRRLMNGLIGVFIGVIIIWIVLLIWDLIEDHKLDLFYISGLLAPLAMIWIPILNLKKIKNELKRRGDM